MEKMHDILTRKSEEIFDRIVEIRRHLHANPELSFEEQQTSEYVREILESIGLEVETGFGGYGLVALIKGLMKDLV
jgi:amidohydrolase